ncbi:MAG TPA: hypothetical protein VIO11_10115 [Candidatus Methanoperedens sp.]
MEFKEINVPEDIVRQIEGEGPFAGIMAGVGNAGIVYPDINFDMSYEDTLEEINMERARYLLSTDEMLEEMLSTTQG